MAKVDEMFYYYLTYKELKLLDSPILVNNMVFYYLTYKELKRISQLITCCRKHLTIILPIRN